MANMVGRRKGDDRMSENKTIYYQNGTFSVEDNLFYENNIRIGYFEDEEKEEIPENNHKAVVDRLTNLRDSNIDLKRSNKKLRKENNELRKESYGNLDGLNYYQEQNGHLSSKISDLECENEQLKRQIHYLKIVCRNELDDETLKQVMGSLGELE